VADDRRTPAAAGPPTETEETVNRESHPNAGGPAGLAGDLGISSERTGPFEGIEGTGSMVSAQRTTDGEDTGVGTGTGSLDPAPPVDKPDETSPISGVDRTVGEVQPDPVERKHEFDPSRNPGH
jgi:hypothetical protein